MEMTAKQKAESIVKIMKSLGKDLNYAVDTAGWYTMTDKEQMDVEKLVKELW